MNAAAPRNNGSSSDNGSSGEQAGGAQATSEPLAPIGGPIAPPVGEPSAPLERVGPASAAPPVPPSSEARLPTLDPVASAHLDHHLPDEAAPGHTRVECPNCSSLWEGNDLRPHAEWFCGTCDFPLFWARSGAVGTGDVGSAFARLPGTDGRDALLSLACPTCGEHNPPVPTNDCLRCGSPLTRPAPVIVAPPPEPVVVTVAPPVPRRRIWPWVVATCVLSAALLVAIVVAVHRG